MDLRAYTRQYARRDNYLALRSYGITFVLYFATLYVAIAFWNYWHVAFFAGVIYAFANVRLYVLQHDCGHFSLFETRNQNQIAGNILSVFTFAPFDAMRYNHDQHHAGLGDLNHRHSNEIHTMTLHEWEGADFRSRLFYRLYRHPFILIPVGSLFTYFIRYRWPQNTMKIGVRNVILHNLSLLAFGGVIIILAGIKGLFIWLFLSFIAGMLGVFLVYLQHNFEDTYWDRRPDLDPHIAALQGSSALDFGKWFDIAVACITLHDIHHFNARIPSYHLRECHYNLPKKYAPRRIGFGEAIRSFGLKLWDEDAKKMVPFPQQNPSKAVSA